nr:hypothetical protein [Leptolyngbyaceae cyanobacterium MAG.088]
WNTESGQLVQELKGHQNLVLNASFSPDGSRIVTASSDNTARVWNTDSLNTLIARGCNYLNAYFATHPTVLETLEICHTSARKLAAATALVEEGDRLAAQELVSLAVERYQTALEWNPALQLSPKQRAQRLANEAEVNRRERRERSGGAR